MRPETLGIIENGPLRGIDEGIFMDIEAGTIDDGTIVEVLDVVAGDLPRSVQLDADGTPPRLPANRVVPLDDGVDTPRVGTTE